MSREFLPENPICQSHKILHGLSAHSFYCWVKMSCCLLICKCSSHGMIARCVWVNNLHIKKCILACVSKTSGMNINMSIWFSIGWTMSKWLISNRLEKWLSCNVVANSVSSVTVMHGSHCGGLLGCKPPIWQIMSHDGDPFPCATSTCAFALVVPSYFLHFILYLLRISYLQHNLQH